MKTIDSLINEANLKQELWATMTDQDLADRNVTRQHSLRLVQYFHGRYDALHDAKNLKEFAPDLVRRNQIYEAALRKIADEFEKKLDLHKQDCFAYQVVKDALALKSN